MASASATAINVPALAWPYRSRWPTPSITATLRSPRNFAKKTSAGFTPRPRSAGPRYPTGIAGSRRHRRISIDADLNRDVVSYTIRDQGPGFNTAKLDEPFDPESLMRVGGRGMLLIRTFMDEVRHNETGNEIQMIKRRKAQ